MRHTVAAAAKLVGKDRKTLYRHIKQGRLSCGFAPDGSRYIDTSELMRAYGDLQPPETPVRQPETPALPQGETAEVVAQLVEEMRALRDELAAVRKELEERPRIEHKPAPDHQPEPAQATSTSHPYGSLIERLKAKQVH